MRSRVLEVVNHVDKVGAAPSQLSRNPGCRDGRRKGSGGDPRGGELGSVSLSLTGGSPPSKLYQELNVRVVLVGLEIWNQVDGIHVSSYANTTLENFLIWRTQRLAGRHQHDNAQLITYVGLEAESWALAGREGRVRMQGTPKGGGSQGTHVHTPLLFPAGSTSPGPPWDWLRCRPCAPRPQGL